MLWRFGFAISVFCAIAISSNAADPLDLARGLRDIGQPDLALDYLADLEATKPAAAVMTLLPLERAKSRLAVAQMETDETAREAGVAKARGEFEAFLKANKMHPRAAEANLALAQVTSVQAINALNSAFREKAPTVEERRKKRVAAAAATRPQFKAAADLFKSAGEAIAKQLKDDGVDAGRKAELTRASLQAELDRGINQYRMAETFADPQGADIKVRGDMLDEAKKIFQDLGRRPEGKASPVCWQARAWAGSCELEKQSRAEAEKIFKGIRDDANRVDEPAVRKASEDGLRMVEYFEAFAKYDAAVAENTKQAFAQARQVTKNWLDKDKYRPRMTPQRLSMTYYHAFLTEKLGLAEVTYEKQSKADEEAKKLKKMMPLNSAGQAYLKEAAREYKMLLDFDNEYSERASENRTRATRFIVGDKPKAPNAYTDLEECQMAGFVQLIAAGEAKAKAAELAEDEGTADGKAKADAARKIEREEYAKALALMERAQALITPATPVKDANEAKLNLVKAYYFSDQFALAAVAGEGLARATKGSAGAAAGLYAVECYLKAREKLDESAEDARSIDRERALSLGNYVDKTFGNDGSADAVRLRLGRLLASEKQFQQAFEMLSRVSAGAADAAVAREIQARVAYVLINSKDSALNAAQKKAVYDKAVKDCSALPVPTGSALKSYFAVRSLLANLHLSNGTDKGITDAQQIAATAHADIQKSALTPAEKTPLLFAADELKLRAQYSQAGKLFEAGKYADVAKLLLPSLSEIHKAGPASIGKLEGEASQAATSLDRFRRDFVILAMNARIREGEFDKAAELFELLEKLGGGVDATTGALNRLVGVVRPQLEELRKAKKDADADKLAASIGTLLQKQSEKPKLPARVLASLGRNLRDLGQYDKAIEVLKKVPAPAAEKLKEQSSKLEEADRDAVIAHTVATIEMARALRLQKKFDEADKILKAAMGTDKEKGWAKALDFRKEAVLLLEDKAFATAKDAPNFGRQRAWGDAKTAWEKIANDYAGIIRNKELPDNEREKFIPVYLELLCDLRRCLARANTQLLADNPTKLAESLGKIAQQVIDVETSPTNAKALNAEVKAKFTALLNDYPIVKAEYQKKGGKAFLEAGN
jgi:hypothetical protein